MQFSHATALLSKEHNRPLAEQVRDYLHAHNCQTEIITSLEDFQAWGKTDLLISLGGDGTLLKCVRYAAPHKTPVFGINCGTLGFLAACEKKEVLNTLAQLLAGHCTRHTRQMLEVHVLQPGKDPQTFTAFNDCILRAAAPRTLLIEAAWNETSVPSYYGDGVIVATPTGSTAYSLAAGGPIVEPSVSVLVVTPICPHSLHQRPIVLPAQGTLQLTPILNYPEDRALVSLDGQTHLSLVAGACVRVKTSPIPALLLCPPDRDFFTVLNRKLDWGHHAD